MRFDDDEEDYYDRSTGISASIIVVSVGVFLLLVLGVVLITNNGLQRKKNPNITSTMQADLSAPGDMANVQNQMADGSSTNTSMTEVVSGTVQNGNDKIGKIRAEDLNFWDMYPEETESVGKNGLKEDPTAIDKYRERKNQMEEDVKKAEEAEQLDPSTDGRHTKVIRKSGAEEWVEITSKIPKSDYVDTGFQDQNGMMKYCISGKDITHFGIDISQKTTAVDYQALMANKVEYVMVRMGARGYDSGTIVLDEGFEQHVTKLKEAGVPYGVYFESQAISEEEVQEELSFMIQYLKGEPLKYPVAIKMELAAGDITRVENLSKEERVTILLSLFDGLKQNGYTPVLFADKEWLLCEMNLMNFTGYDIWYQHAGDLPDFPYAFKMWQYQTSGNIVPGMTGEYGLNISFVDYASR